MADLKPKRGFVSQSDWNGMGNPDAPRAYLWDENPGCYDPVPVLLVPDPDRAPTEAEVDALARACIRAAFGTKEMYEAPSDSELALARAAWRLGARVQA